MKHLLLYINDYKIILTIVSLIVITFILKTNDKSKINIVDLIRKHFSTLKVFGTGKVDKNDINIFFILPIFIAIILALYMKIDDTRLGIIVTAFTIFIGLLFNILAILLAFDGERNKKIDKIFIKEVLYNVSFSIIVAILVIVVSLFMFIKFNSIIHVLLDFILLYLILVFILTLFMVLKRLFNLLTEKIDNN
ncbi:hypothetical protein K2F40_14755 [Clostridium sp. CM028]|uniref:hypothetical protein n=1 Tax=unclassified Clostridium TaxID=2614128 RepID=UPI001C6DF530|nr:MULTISPECIES: hypothetical protein [unclassified Clostridium]MBW9146844.1 hypothetical protein [Clostridium sp. CM027]MBW9150218.1 hypothetical protein [Clostridium sp. CM028]UVE42825.1 hypothetical protein KTC92_18045 [Clostridium sp. CM027]WLC63486.1 hypothetical protein KTC94_17320 [Clostridium sp. CM028]